MAKRRVQIATDVAATILHEADRTCCVCRLPDKAVQIHHIDNDPSNNDPSNLAVLCLQHHDDTELRGGFGRKLDAAQVKLYKEEWIEIIAERKRRATEIVASAMAHSALLNITQEDDSQTSSLPARQSFRIQGVDAFVAKIPSIVRLSFQQIELQDDISTSGMMDASEERCSILAEVWLHFMTIRRDPSADRPSLDEMLDRYRKVTSEIDYELEYPDGYQSNAGSMQRLHDAHNRFLRMRHLIEISVEHHFRDEFGGTDDGFKAWLTEFHKAC